MGECCGGGKEASISSKPRTRLAGTLDPRNRWSFAKRSRLRLRSSSCWSMDVVSKVDWDGELGKLDLMDAESGGSMASSDRSMKDIGESDLFWDAS